MQNAVLEIAAWIVVLITVIDFIFDAILRENIVSIIRKMIRKTDNAFEAAKSQKRVTYFSILFKLLSLCFLLFSMAFLHLSWGELVLYILATSIFIVNITVLVTRAIN
jgi:hypothetical protein